MRHFCLFIILVLLGFPPATQAFSLCKCTKKFSVEEDFQRSFGVFTGTVTRIVRKLNPDVYQVRFNVHESWKGVTHPTVSVFTEGLDIYTLGTTGITCGYNFKPDETYLVFSFRQKNRRGPAFVSACSHTIPLSQAENILKTLGEPNQRFEHP